MKPPPKIIPIPPSRQKAVPIKLRIARIVTPTGLTILFPPFKLLLLRRIVLTLYGIRAKFFVYPEQWGPRAPMPRLRTKLEFLRDGWQRARLHGWRSQRSGAKAIRR